MECRLHRLMYFFVLFGLSSCQPETDLDAEVIIIGAGMSGVSAAAKLQESGINDILILEGSGKVGGRIASVEFAGVTVSTGATWIQGLDPASPGLHPLWQIAERCTNGTGLRGFNQDYDSLTTYDSQGRELTDDSFRWDDYDEASAAVKELAVQLEANGQCVNTSLRYGLNVSGWSPVTPADDWVEWYSIDYCSGVRPELLDLCLDIMGSLITRTSFSSPGSEGIDYFVTDPNGMVSIVECIADEVLENRESRLRLNTVVTEIDWSNDACVCVTANVGGSSERFCGRYAILTASVGVLQTEGAIRFIPELPSWKREVIPKFELSKYAHIIMEFESVFWSSTEFIGHINDTRGYYPLFVNLNNIFPENPKVLMAVLAGDIVETVLAQPDAAISEIEQILGTIYPGSNTTVVSSLFPDWKSNPLYRGSFSYPKLGLERKDYGLLAAPVGNLYFSGEATSADFYGFIHGAYFAGIDTAESIAERTSRAAAVHASILLIVLGIFISATQASY